MQVQVLSPAPPDPYVTGTFTARASDIDGGSGSYMDNWKKSAADRRDARHTKDSVDKPKPRKKDTRKWCGGKFGIEHKPGVFPYNFSMKELFQSWKVLACKVCGKHLEIYYGRGAKPDWLER